MNRLALLIGLGLSLNAEAAPMAWDSIRDASLYLRTDRPATVTVSWVPAWQADANEEQLYLIDGQGRLTGERQIKANESRGSQRWPLAPSAASYRLEIPGYSFRRYRVETDEHTAVLFAPVKLHFSAHTRDGDELYFNVGAGEQAILAGKYHDGVNALHAERVSDDKQLDLVLKPYRDYWQYDQVALPVDTGEQVWRLTLRGSGKAAFWLDGTANLFAQAPQSLTPLRQDDGQVHLTVRGDVIGRTPDLGAALPYALPPPETAALFEALKPRAATYYSFVDLSAKRPQYEDPFRRFYQEHLGITHDITLLAGTGRVADLRADTVSNAGLDAWLAGTRALGGKGLHYIAFADEPNLNYASYADYQAIFTHMALQVRSDPANYRAGVRIAMPASSRLVNGPLADNARERRGIDWARRLLKESGEQIDALAWHEWMVRDLLATRVYRDTVRRAADLVGLDTQGRPRKALLLDQTNISSGPTLSPYEQETHFASLWWASVAINSAQDGLLDMLNWFQIDDEGNHRKGMLRDTGNEHYVLKPVGYAQQFIARHWLKDVVRLDNDAFEVDVLAMADGPRRSLLGVNKTPRRQQVSVLGIAGACPTPRDALMVFGADNQSRPAPFQCLGGRVSFELPGETLFALRWSAS
ncbi:hypothetical protein SAMN04487857_102469 [Pseudomonas sp. ok272]|uniref:hypothetical protein n=1 Tax=unclassified Pseudomonas TaxID=196821 RepID=UPI0008C8159C|nr:MULTISPECIES: hypothetical protein [unclassified Pseudomonas]SEM53083.1 hypothetical protein SAMN04487857_102469 [Pseudomonas sp. ok272]SFM24955.1 hypothetical protein SAMN04487858_101471 [Pseudomonas sp. ok602]